LLLLRRFALSEFGGPPWAAKANLRHDLFMSLRPVVLSLTPLALILAPTALAAETPGHFAIRVVTYEDNGQFGPAWRLLHPAHQKVADAAELSDCSGRPNQFPTSKLRVRSQYREPWRIAGVGVRPTTALTLERYMVYHEEGQEIRSVLERFTMHVLRVGAGWKWILNAKTYQALKSNSC
jgi:hypothetical protein